MVIYFMEFLDPKYPFFFIPTKFLQCIFKRIHWILTSSNGPIKISYNTCTYMVLHYPFVEYENGKVKPAHYVVEIVDFNDANDQRQE